MKVHNSTVQTRRNDTARVKPISAIEMEAVGGKRSGRSVEQR